MIETIAQYSEKLGSFQEVIAALQRPFPDDAFYSYTKDGQKFTSVHVQYLINRFNEVCGYGRWYFNHTIIHTIGPSENYEVHANEKGITFQKGDYNPYAVVRGSLTIAYKEGNKIMAYTTPEQYGGNANLDTGDAYKGAVTDCMIKCSQFLGILEKMYINDPIDKKRSAVGNKVNSILNKLKNDGEKNTSKI